MNIKLLKNNYCYRGCFSRLLNLILYIHHRELELVTLNICSYYGILVEIMVTMVNFWCHLYLSPRQKKNPVDQSFACYALTKAVKLTVNNCSYKKNLALRHFIHTGPDLTLFTPVLVLDGMSQEISHCLFGQETCSMEADVIASPKRVVHTVYFVCLCSVVMVRNRKYPSELD